MRVDFGPRFRFWCPDWHIHDVKLIVIGTVALGGLLAFCLAPVVVVAAVVSGGLPSGPSAAAEREIPAHLLAHYEQSPACRGLPWQVIAAIGYVESRHGTTNGTQVDSATGDTTPPIVGIALDGRRTAAIRTPQGGSAWHGDAMWDHAVGPMQFITETWSRWGADASGDGVASPHNAYDAIAAAGRYLCNGRTAFADQMDVEKAIGAYNAGSGYLDSVLDKAYEYGMTDGGDPVGMIGAVRSAPEHGPQVKGDAEAVVAYALAQVGDPYVWGAAGPDSFDCSGLTMRAFGEVGVILPHRSDRQVRYGEPVNWSRDGIRAGDLIFLRGGSPVHDYGHVGIAVDARRWVVAPRTGQSVQVTATPIRRVQAVRRIITNE